MNEKEKRFLEVLTRVKVLLEQNNLSYFLDTGTLLGAVAAHICQCQYLRPRE